MTSSPPRVAVIAFLLVMLASGASAQDRFLVGTNWLPDAERGGFYQADAAGIQTIRRKTVVSIVFIPIHKWGTVGPTICRM